jgi:predicted AAA+ superfamily ATPase
MQYLTTIIISRLTIGSGHPVIFLSTEFGGGKTHTLLLLYHLFKNREEGFNFLKSREIHKELSISNIPEIKIVAIDCRILDPLSITLSGEIARQLGQYETVKHYDEQRIVPNIDLITEMVDKSVLILIDELPQYTNQTPFSSSRQHKKQALCNQIGS